jgi:hypothetical protein
MPREIDFRYAPEIIQTCIGFVDDPHKTIVREDGSLNYDYDMSRIDIEEQTGYAEQTGPYHEPTDDNQKFRYRLTPRFTHADEFQHRRQTYGDPDREDDAEAAVVTTTEEYADSELTWTVFAHAPDEETRVDVVRWTLTADDGFGRAPSRVELKLDGPDDEARPTIVESPGTTDYWTEQATQLPGLDHYAFLTGGETREGAFAVVLEGDIDPETVTVDWADRALAATCAYWRDVQPFQNRFEIPDEGIQKLLTSCGRNILQAREEVDGLRQYQVGPTEYRGLWIADGYFFLECAHMLGRGEEAFRNGLLALQRHVRPDGSIQILPKHTKETGIAIATFVRQCELADDDDRLVELWPTIRRAVAFLEGKFEEATRMGEEYPAQALFPPAFIDGGISGPYPEYTTPLLVLWGLKRAAEAGERLDLDGHRRIAAFCETVREGVDECADRDIRETDDGLPYLPMNMVEREYDRPQTATASLAIPASTGEVFPPDSRYVQNLLALLATIDDRQGLPENVGWMHDQGIFTYAGALYGQLYLYAGDGEKAADYLYAFANHAAPSRVWREEQAFRDCHSAEFTGDMPHNWASVEFIRLVRAFVLTEHRGDVELLRGLPEEWLPTDEPLVLESTPTRYGRYDVRLAADETGTQADSADEWYVLTVARDPGNQSPGRVLVHWDGAVEATDGTVTALGDGRWQLSEKAGEIRLGR